jgi:hypothetical protein
MYLIHNTSLPALKSILQDRELKSLSLLKKQNKNFSRYAPNEGEGIYTKNNFVYFSCTDKLYDKNIIGHVTMYFNSKLLFNKSFYLSTMHSPHPEGLYESRIDYKRKYNGYYNKYNTVLKKLYNYSISKLKNGRAFQIFQQIAVRNKVNLNELVAIEFNNKILVTDSIIKYITKMFPNVEIKIN